MLVVAAFMSKYTEDRSGSKLTLSDAYWFAFITTTTVGLGDYHLAHEEFRAEDMFYIPMAILFGFNILHNFAEKLVETFVMYMPTDMTYEHILEADRIADASTRRQSIVDKKETLREFCSGIDSRFSLSDYEGENRHSHPGRTKE